MKQLNDRPRNNLLTTLLFLLLLVPSSGALAVDEINTGFFGNLAIKGYDPVAYFTEERPVEGEKQFTMSWKGANWRFASAANLAAFMEDPEKYAPQYGGYCAWAVSQNDTANIDPTQFTVYNEKLYLNYDKKISARWKVNKDSFITDADHYWPQLLQD